MNLGCDSASNCSKVRTFSLQPYHVYHLSHQVWVPQSLRADGNEVTSFRPKLTLQDYANFVPDSMILIAVVDIAQVKVKYGHGSGVGVGVLVDAMFLACSYRVRGIRSRRDKVVPVAVEGTICWGCTLFLQRLTRNVQQLEWSRRV